MKKYTATKIGLFDTVIEISGYTESEERFNEVKAEVFARLGDLHQDFDIYNSYGITHNTNLARVNASAGSEYRSHIISREVYELLTFGKEIYSLTNGKVNIAMGSVLSLWRDCLNAENPHLPDAEALAKAAAHTDINGTHSEADHNSIGHSFRKPLFEQPADRASYNYCQGIEKHALHNIISFLCQMRGNSGE